MNWIIIDGPNGRRKVEEGQPYVLAPSERIVGAEGSSNVTDSSEMKELSEAFEAEGILLGDAIAKATKMIGFRQCSSCSRRQEWLNEWHRRGKAFVKEIADKLKRTD